MSAPGFLVEALARRRAEGVAPFTVVSCDNLPSNGKTARNVLTRMASLRDAGFGAWVAGDVAFPSTMVDRIVPATTDEDRARIAARLGAEDAWPIVTEPFSQWVIEDGFPTGRPRFEDSGATLVQDVAPYELAKLRLLNGSHSTLAYLGYLAGYETVSDVMANESFARLVAELMEKESAPTLDAGKTGDLKAYMRELLARFRNPALRHLNRQIAMDGSQKLPQRLLGAVRARLARGAPIERLALGVAGWMRYVTGVDERGGPIDVRDPLSAQLKLIADRGGTRRRPSRPGARGRTRDLRRRPRRRSALSFARDGGAREADQARQPRRRRALSAIRAMNGRAPPPHASRVLEFCDRQLSSLFFALIALTVGMVASIPDQRGASPKPTWREPQAGVAPNPSGSGAKPKSMPTFSNSYPLPL